ncbi:hypothetical protein DFJ73DRAFT_781680 [Zopfochytrium polystomum]|nr:hypothetical protein DFJ73DRAFT_781680 [Zopfochytrium polystomum]
MTTTAPTAALPYQPPRLQPPVSPAELARWRALLHPDLRDDEDRWTIILTVACAAAHAIEGIPLIYTVATADSSSDGDDAGDARAVRTARRIKEALLKGSVLYGIPPAIDATFALADAVRADAEARGRPARIDDEAFFSRAGESLGPATATSYDDEAANGGDHDDDGEFVRTDSEAAAAAAAAATKQDDADVTARGAAHIRAVYRHNLPDIALRFRRAAALDLWRLTRDVNYGMTLSHSRVLGLADTELVVLAALVTMNLRAETLWHLRGARRVGWKEEVVASVRDACVEACRFWGRPTDRVPRVDEVSEESNGL